MKQNGAINNRVFINALLGSLLFVLAFSFIITNFANIALFHFPYTLVSALLVSSSVSLLYRAIKDDRAGWSKLPDMGE